MRHDKFGNWVSFIFHPEIGARPISLEAEIIDLNLERVGRINVLRLDEFVAYIFRVCRESGKAIPLPQCELLIASDVASRGHQVNNS